MFASNAATEEEAFATISQALLSVSEVQSCVESELASQWGIYSTLQCFAPLEEPAVISFLEEHHIDLDVTSAYVEPTVIAYDVEQPLIVTEPENPIEEYLDVAFIEDFIDFQTSPITDVAE